MFKRSKRKEEKEDEYSERPHHDKGQDEDGHYESMRDMLSKQKKGEGKKPFQERYDNDDDDEKMDKRDATEEDNTDEDTSESMNKDPKCKKYDKEKEKRKKVIAIIIKKGLRNRNE
jgi:hypothetical protein